MAAKTKTRTKKRPPLTPEQRAEKREQEKQLVKEAVEQLRSSEGWQSWLTTRSRFHRYSWINQLLINMQHPTATNVTGFRKWLDLGYAVKKGEHGIRIWAPMPPSKRAKELYAEAKKRGEECEPPRTLFRLVSVFAQDQVGPLPPPAEPKPLSPPSEPIEGDSLAHLLPALVKLAKELGVTVNLDGTPDELGRALGALWPAEDRIAVLGTLCPNEKVKVLIHELGHALVRKDRHDDDPELDYAAEECVVESVAFSVCRTFGLPVDGAAVPYIAGWSQGRDDDLSVLERAAQLVNRLCNRIEKVAE